MSGLCYIFLETAAGVALRSFCKCIKKHTAPLGYRVFG